jgi:lipopolysaccharide transport system ATP-binding protein
MQVAIKVEGLSKRFLLGQTFERTLTSRIGDLLGGRGLSGRAAVREEFWALREIDFEVAEGEAIGIIGGNGAGKSTLLKVLSRITPPTSGRARVRGRLSSLLEVGTGFHPELTGRENVFLNGAILGMRRSEVERKLDEIVAFAGVEKFIDTPVKRYSSGMYVRLAFAVAAHLEPDVLIIDEVLAVGDAEFQKRCLGKMGEVAREGRTVLFVSHNMAAVQKLCQKAAWLHAGRLVGYGSSSDVVEQYLESTSAESSEVGPRGVGQVFSRAEPSELEAKAAVTSVVLQDAHGSPLASVRTWQSLVVEIEFSSHVAFRSLAVELSVSTLDGTPLFVTSTTPDRNVAFGVQPGRYRVRCRIGQLPLASGEYVVGLRLAIPWVEYVWRSDNAFKLHVDANDVFNSGFAPSTRRSHVVVAHDWEPPVAMSNGRVMEVDSA